MELLVDYFNPHSGDNVVKRFQAKLETNDPILAQSLHEKLEEKQEERENKLEYVKSIDEAINALEEQLAEKEKELDENQDILKDQEEKKEIKNLNLGNYSCRVRKKHLTAVVQV